MSIEKKQFGKTKRGESVDALTLTNNNETAVTVLTYGATLLSILVKDKDGNFRDVLLGHPDVSDYEIIDSYIGATIGRYANRIADGRFMLLGKEYILAKNNMPNHLHGGMRGYNDYVWKIDDTGENFVTLSHEDVGEGYPGKVSVSVTFSLSDDDELSLHYKAKTDETTVINLTNHSYFNLNGYNGGKITEHSLKIDADYYTPSNENLIPTGEIKDVTGTPFDFREYKKIGADLNTENEDLKMGNGYDHNFVLNSPSKTKESVSIYSEESGIELKLYTDMPAMQFYIGNFLNGKETGKDGKPIEHRTGFCLETQYYPDSPNHDNFPSTVLTPDKTYDHTTIFKFGLK